MKVFSGINLKYALPGAPQKIIMLKWGFTSLKYWIHAIMAHVGLNLKKLSGLWTECASTATNMENIMVIANEELFTQKT